VKTPNLRQPSSGLTIYPAIKLLPRVSIPLAQNPHLPGRPNTTPMIPANKGASPQGRSKPLGPTTNTVNQVR
jgi:hypothetical protein